MALIYLLLTVGLLSVIFYTKRFRYDGLCNTIYVDIPAVCK